jgi:hypothetical protein
VKSAYVCASTRNYYHRTGGRKTTGVVVHVIIKLQYINIFK